MFVAIVVLFAGVVSARPSFCPAKFEPVIFSEASAVVRVDWDKYDFAVQGPHATPCVLGASTTGAASSAAGVASFTASCCSSV